MPELPDFPVDPGMLGMIEAALAEDNTSVDRVLELLSGYNGDGEEHVRQGVPATHIGQLYHVDDVILALITEVRELRALVARLREGRPIAGRGAR